MDPELPDHARSLGPPDPLGQPPRADVSPNTNPAVGSTGPNVPVAGEPSAQQGAEGGFGATHVMYDQLNPPLAASAWAGWPVQWDTPNTNSLGASIGGMYGASVDSVYAAVDLNARTFADMPPYVTTKRGEFVTPDPSWLGNPQPERYRSWIDFASEVWLSWQLAGEAFVVATSRFADGFPRTFCMVNPLMVDAELQRGVTQYRINGRDATDDLLHIKYQSWPDDARGHGPLEAANNRLAAVAALGRYGTDLAVNGGIPWAVLQSKFRLTAGQAAGIRQQWVAAAHNRQGAPAILDSDLQLTPLMVSPKDMALSEQMAMSEARLSVLLGVPPFLLSLSSGADASMTYTNVAQIHDQHWRTMLKPGGHRIFAALSNWALPAGQTLQLNAESYIRPDPKTRAETYQLLLTMGALTVDEIRRNENLPPLPAGAAPAPNPTPSPEGQPDDPTAGIA